MSNPLPGTSSSSRLRTTGYLMLMLVAVLVGYLVHRSGVVGEFWGHMQEFLIGDQSGQDYFDTLPKPLFLILIALATHISEDLTCLASGFLASQRIISFPEAVGACFIGIYVGDVLLFLAGRWLGEPCLKLAPFRWFISQAQVNRAGVLFEKRGAMLIIISRFIPGTRAPVYFAAGVARAHLGKFLIYFGIACAAWTPLLVGAAKLFGRQMIHLYASLESMAVPFLIVASALLYFLFHYGLPALTWRGRRLLVGKWRRLVGWEFWPSWTLYLPIGTLVVLKSVFKYRKLALCTAVNPAIPHSGFVGESKSAILAAAAGPGDGIARWALIPPGPTPARMDQLKAFVQSLSPGSLHYPIVLKPDEGQRGLGVKIVHNEEEAIAYLTNTGFPVIAQEYIGGCEYGIFYYRFPGENERAQILGITDKRMLYVIGDGRSTFEKLILNDHRAVCKAPTFLTKFAERLDDVPAKGAHVPLTDLGTHCRGALFLDGSHLATEALRSTLENNLRHFKGFHYGRIDYRVPSADDLQAGKNGWIIEVNGLTSEDTSMYDPRHSLWHGYRTLWKQWSICLRLAQAVETAHQQSNPQSTLCSKPSALLRDIYKALQKQKTYELRQGAARPRNPIE